MDEDIKDIVDNNVEVGEILLMNPIYFSDFDTNLLKLPDYDYLRSTIAMKQSTYDRIMCIINIVGYFDYEKHKIPTGECTRYDQS